MVQHEKQRKADISDPLSHLWRKAGRKMRTRRWQTAKNAESHRDLQEGLCSYGRWLKTSTSHLGFWHAFPLCNQMLWTF